MYDPHAYVDLCVENILRRQLLHQPVGNQLVIFRLAQALGNGLERHHEALKILVRIEPLHVRFTQHISTTFGAVAVILCWQRSVMTLAKLSQSVGINCPFQVEVEFALRKGGDESPGIHTDALTLSARERAVSRLNSWVRRTTVINSTRQKMASAELHKSKM